MDFTEIIRGIELFPSPSKPTHASALLVWFARPTAKVRRVLELGSGSGIVSIAISRIYGREVLGIELIEDLVKAAERSAELNGIEGMARFIQGDVRDIRRIVDAESFDMVVSNPPHHVFKDHSPDGIRAAARTASEDLIDAFVDAISWSLRNGGEYVLVLSPEGMMEWLFRLKARRLEPKRMVFFHPKDKAELVAVRGRKNGRVGLVVEKPILGR